MLNQFSDMDIITTEKVADEIYKEQPNLFSIRNSVKSDGKKA